MLVLLVEAQTIQHHLGEGVDVLIVDLFDDVFSKPCEGNFLKLFYLHVWHRLLEKLYVEKSLRVDLGLYPDGLACDFHGLHFVKLGNVLLTFQEDLQGFQEGRKAVGGVEHFLNELVQEGEVVSD